MRAQALAHQVISDHSAVETLETFLMSDRSSPDSMTLSELDGFLTGIAIGPELMRPSEWLPLIWGNAAPGFADLDEANAILGSLMARYNEILRDIADDALAPIFWADGDGAIIAADWAEGFLQAIILRPDAWEPLFRSKRDGKLLFPIVSLCCDANGDSLLGLPPEAGDGIVAQMPELIPACVIAIAIYWRYKGRRQGSMSGNAGSRGSTPSRATTKVGRNDPCPCGSGKKLKKCCSQPA
jgi:uncharacterized protein